MKIIVFLLCIFYLNISFSQERVEGTSYIHFQLKDKNDVIDFVVADTNLTVQKPLLLFCQGSQPVPLFIQFNQKEDGMDGIFPVALNNFDLDYLNTYFHVVVISKPHTPLIATTNQLNQAYNYITDPTQEYSYDENYLKADFVENYINRANRVIHYLLKKEWINNSKIVVAGHSQGAREAVGIAYANKKVTHVGLFGYNPHGRIDQYIRQARKDAESGKITWGKADSISQQQKEFYQLIQNEDSIKSNPPLVSWVSFSKPTINQLVKIKAPIYIAYGSEDIVADLCDLLPFNFIDVKKENYLIKRYSNVEHNFFPVKDDGSVDYNNGKWIEVMNGFIDWTIKQ